MARRERTTGLPRPRRREVATRGGFRVGSRTIGQGQMQAGVLGFCILLGVIVLGLIAKNEYQDRIQRPNSAVLTVADEKFKLSYYTDRLFGYLSLQQGSGTSSLVAEEGLLVQLEREGLTELIAKDRGIVVSDDDITQAIADSLSVPVGGSGSSFDTLYRERLKTQNISDGNFRRQIEAQTYDTRLFEQLKLEVGTAGEMLTLRSIIVESKEKADAVIARIQAGEDFGTVAQQESADLESRQQDGVMTPVPTPLLPEALRTATDGKQAGTETLGPIEVGTGFWVVRIEKRDPAGAYTTGNQEQLADTKLEELIAAKRSQVKISRSLDADDVTWAEAHLTD